VGPNIYHLLGAKARKKQKQHILLFVIFQSNKIVLKARNARFRQIYISKWEYNAKVWGQRPHRQRPIGVWGGAPGTAAILQPFF